MAAAQSIHPFPARMASELALNAMMNLKSNSLVIDPMCGSGTTVKQALDNGHRAIGIDIDPLSVLMSQVWSRPMPTGINLHLADVILQQAAKLPYGGPALSWIDDDQETSDYVKFWFGPAQTRQLRAIVHVAEGLDSNEQDLVRLALSRTIITKSRGASLAADVSHSRPHRVKEENDYNVMDGFKKAFKRLYTTLRNSPPPRCGEVWQGDARHLVSIPGNSADAVVTSPPYLDAIDYLRGHKLALVWMGYRLKDLRDIRSRGVGAIRREENTTEECATQTTQDILSDHASPKLKGMVSRYIRDISDCLAQTRRILRPSGVAVYVISNSLLQGSEVNTENIIVRAADRAGLRLEDSYSREISRAHRYLPPPQNAGWGQLAKRMRTESVLRFRKPLS